MSIIFFDQFLILLLLAAVASRILQSQARPMPMGDKTPSKQSEAANKWWIDALNQALDHPTTLIGGHWTLNPEQEHGTASTGSLPQEHILHNPTGVRVDEYSHRHDHSNLVPLVLPDYPRDAELLPSRPSHSNIHEHLAPLKLFVPTVEKAGYLLPHEDQSLHYLSPIGTTLTDRGSLFSGWATSSPTEPRYWSQDQNIDHWNMNEGLDGVQAHSGPEFKSREIQYSIPATKFLKQHPLFYESSGEERSKVPMTVPEISPDAGILKIGVNRYLFGDKLDWKARGDEMFAAIHQDDLAMQFVLRINTRRSIFTTRNTLTLQTVRSPVRLVVIPHRNYKDGSVMFDAEPGLKRLLFSFWAPSQDEELTRLQFVGAASLTVEEAGHIIAQATIPDLHAHHAARQADNMYSSVRGSASAASREGSHAVIPGGTTNLYASSNHWLKQFPLVREETNPESRLVLAANLVSRLHENSEQIKEIANTILFGGAVVWQIKPLQAMQELRSQGTRDPFRYHKQSESLFVPKTELLTSLRYNMVLIPYEVPGRSSRLFEATLRGESHTFTLWASRVLPGGPDSHMLDFVGGGSLSGSRIEGVLQHAYSSLHYL